MKTIVAKNNGINMIEDSIPITKPSYLLIKTMYSVISPGTELSLIEKSEGRTVSLGYSAVGVVEECGEGTDGFSKGDLVACYGAPYVKHSEYLLVPKTLCCKVPNNVQPKEAALAGIGAIAIHALRISKLEFGETIVIAGLGLLGQMIAQVANAAAFKVFAYDVSEERASMLVNTPNILAFSDLAKLEESIKSYTSGHGADAIHLCAGGKNSPLTNQCLYWVRDRGKVVIVGDIEPHFPRDLMFGKEAQVLISRAGGPGRYDKIYEEQAIDYPYGFVRWPEGRNVSEYLRLVSEKRIDVTSFINEVVELNNVCSIYEGLINKNTRTLTKVIQYPN
ncbi:zinc-dependent alcohol dehydrogenase [Heyndrickxia sporothermodurans]